MLFFLSLAICVSWAIVRGDDDFSTNKAKRVPDPTAAANDDEQQILGPVIQNNEDPAIQKNEDPVIQKNEDPVIQNNEDKEDIAESAEPLSSSNAQNASYQNQEGVPEATALAASPDVTESVAVSNPEGGSDESDSADIEGVDDGDTKPDSGTEEYDAESTDSDSPDADEAGTINIDEDMPALGNNSEPEDIGSEDNSGGSNDSTASTDSGDSGDSDDGPVYVHLAHTSVAPPKIHIHIRHQMRKKPHFHNILSDVWVAPLTRKQIERARRITELAASVPDRETDRCGQYIAQKDALRVKINVLTNKIQALRVQLEDMPSTPFIPTKAPLQGALSVAAGDPESSKTMGAEEGKQAQTPKVAQKDVVEIEGALDGTSREKQDVTTESETEIETNKSDKYWLFTVLLFAPCLFLVLLLLCYCRDDSGADARSRRLSQQNERRFENPAPVRQWNDGTASRTMDVPLSDGVDPVAVGGSSGLSEDRMGSSLSFVPSADFPTPRVVRDSGAAFGMSRDSEAMHSGSGDIGSARDVSRDGMASSVPSNGNNKPFQLQFSFEDEKRGLPKSKGTPRPYPVDEVGRGGKNTY